MEKDHIVQRTNILGSYKPSTPWDPTTVRPRVPSEGTLLNKELHFSSWGALCDLRTTWFVISPIWLRWTKHSPPKLQLFGLGSLGLCAKEKSTLTFWRFHWGLGKRRGKKQSLRKHGSKARKHLEEGKFLLVCSTSRSQKCGFLQWTSYQGTIWNLGNFPTQDKFYASLFSPFYILNIMDWNLWFSNG